MAATSNKRKAKQAFLGNYLPYLLNRLTREMLRGVDEKFSRRDLTVTKWRILAVLSDKGTCRFGALVDLTSIEPATLSRFVGRLDDEGLITRRRPRSDARTVQITLTDKGSSAFAATLPWAFDVERRLTRKLTAAQVKTLKSILDQMFENIRSVELPELSPVRAEPAKPPMSPNS